MIFNINLNEKAHLNVSLQVLLKIVRLKNVGGSIKFLIFNVGGGWTWIKHIFRIQFK